MPNACAEARKRNALSTAYEVITADIPYEVAIFYSSESSESSVPVSVEGMSCANPSEIRYRNHKTSLKLIVFSPSRRKAAKAAHERATSLKQFQKRT